jgi:hypothetical protein
MNQIVTMQKKSLAVKHKAMNLLKKRLNSKDSLILDYTKATRKSTSVVKQSSEQRDGTILQ